MKFSFDDAKTNFAALGVVVLIGLAIYQTYTSESPEPVAAASSNQLALVQQQVSKFESQLRRERVIDLPEDSGKWYTVLIFRDNKEEDHESRRLASIVATTPRLQSLLSQTHVKNYTPSNRYYRSKGWSKYLGNSLPALVVMQPSGKVCYKVSGQNIPSDGDVIADGIQKSIDSCFPRPKPKPTPQPQPTPAPPAIPDISPPDEQPKPEPSPDIPFWYYLIPFAGAALGLRRGVKNEFAE